jgi:HAD superfamily hydrolase (TIGR01549 family)
MRRVIDTVLFDLDDTLHDDSDAYHRAARTVAEEVAAEHGIEAAALHQAYVTGAQSYWSGLTVEQMLAGIESARVRLWHEALLAFGIDDTALADRCTERYADYRATLLGLFPGAQELLETLRVRGCKLGIVTNGFVSTHTRKLDVLGLRPLVDAIFLADEMGMVKPDPGCFTHACRVLDSDPRRTAMVGDRYDRDVIGAQAAGLFTVLIDVHRIPLPPGGQPADAVVGSVAEVLEVLPLAARQEAYSELPKRLA